MKKLHIISTAISASCVIGVLVILFLIGNRVVLPQKTALEIDQKPFLVPESSQERQREFSPLGASDNIDMTTTSSISSSVKKSDDLPVKAIRNKNNNIASVSAPPSKTTIVQPGDTLWSIALRNKMEITRLAILNNIEIPFTIYPGQVLKLSRPQ